MNSTSETQAYADLLGSHLQGLVYRLRRLPEDKWDFSFAPAAPTPRTLATHALQWLICDRQHIAEPDALKHSDVPEPPQETPALCDLLAEEAERWQALILSLTPEQLDAPRKQFNGYPMTVRDFVTHIIQNSIYKHGQFSTIYFALGLDGTEPYNAPFPNPIYARMRAAGDTADARETADA